MKRVVFVVNTVMTLMSSVYYATQVKKIGLDIETALIWQNPTKYRIYLRQFKNCFDVVYEVQKSVSIWGIISPETLRNEFMCKKYLDSSGISDYLKKKYDRDVLMVGADYNGTMGVAIRIYSRKLSSKRIILFEEGMALYSDKRRTLRDILDYNLGKEVDTQPIIGGCSKVQTVFVQRPDKLPAWKSRNKRIIRQSDAFADESLWKKILERDEYLRELSAELKNKKVVLYLGQPIHEFSGKFRSPQEIRLIEEILREMPDDYRMLLKAHPRDAVNKYNKLNDIDKCVVFDRKAGWYPIECLLHLFDIHVVITFSSSAALNILERIPSCRAIYTYRYFGIPISESWDDMYRSYGERVKIPVSLEKFGIETFEGDKDGYTVPEKTAVSYKRRKAEDLRYLCKYLSY